MGWLSDFLSGGKNPADAAMPYLNQIPGMAQQHLNPYIQRGETAYHAMQKPFEQMAQDPAGMLESLMGKYEPSKAYQVHRDEAMRAAANTAAAGGMRGSAQDSMGEGRLVDS